MNASLAPVRSGMPWYRVPEVWLIVLLLGATVIGSLSLVATAVRHPDTHLAVPNDSPRPSKLPPVQAAPASEAAAVPAE